MNTNSLNNSMFKNFHLQKNIDIHKVTFGIHDYSIYNNVMENMDEFYYL